MIAPSLPGLGISFIGGGGISIGVASLLSCLPRSNFWGPVIARGPVDERHGIALTFDDGPDGEFTPRVLDTLQQYDVPATFFVIGRNVERFPEVIARIHQEGHIVANHTWDHDHHGYIRGPRYWASQFDRTDDAIERILGHRPRLFRPPMGMRTGHVTRAAEQRGHAVITWTRRGFDGVRTTSAAIQSRLGPRTQPGEIVILHDGVEPHSRRSPAATCEALGTILREWKKRGLQPQRLDRWLDRPAYALDTTADP